MMELSRKEAIKIANEKIEELNKYSHYPMMLMEEKIIEFEYGWLFLYQSKKYLETKNFLDMLGGNAPFIIDKFNRNIVFTGTREKVSFYIKQYYKYRDNLEEFHKHI